MTRDAVPHFHSPADLETSRTPIDRILLVSSCQMQGLQDVIREEQSGIACDFILNNNTSELADSPPFPPSDYSFQVIQLPVRNILNESQWFRLAYDDLAGHEAMLDAGIARMQLFLQQAMKWNIDHGIPAFICNFLVPQRNSFGSLLPRDHLSNPVYLFERLNQALREEIARYSNAHILDIDQLSSIYGKRYIQDDAWWLFSHSALVCNWDHEHDRNRLEELKPLSAQVEIRPVEFMQNVWREAVAMHRIIRQVDAVKMVVVDLDDTLWRGVAAEQETAADIPGHVREGWPLGFVEALLFLKKRGVLLGILSKNDEQRVVPIFERIYRSHLQLDDFAVRKINWRAKSENMAEMLAEVNILPKNVVFIDDNPVERAAMTAEFPEIRCLGENPYHLRRILMWGPETQLPMITAESLKRTTMVQAQIVREEHRRRMTRPEFLKSLDIKIAIEAFRDTENPKFPRAFELLNKTNQFNTTGRRWTRAECVEAFARGAEFHHFTVTDKFTDYGLVGVAILVDGTIEQFVMSCRVVGLDVELAVLSTILQTLRRRGFPTIQAQLIETEANGLARTLWSKLGFQQVGDFWHLVETAGICALPEHVSVSIPA